MAYALSAYALVIGVLLVYGVSIQRQRRALERQVAVGHGEGVPAPRA